MHFKKRPNMIIVVSTEANEKFSFLSLCWHRYLIQLTPKGTKARSGMLPIDIQAARISNFDDIKINKVELERENMNLVRQTGRFNPQNVFQ